MSSVVMASGLIPPRSLAFRAVLAVHIPTGLTCVITGASAALSKKRHGGHPRFGTIYYWSLSVVFATTSALAALRWPEDVYLLVLGTVSFAAASIGRSARRHRRRHWVSPHIMGMGSSFIVLLAAFYVDNAKNLPLWRDLPHTMYSLLPVTIGTPLVARALVRYQGQNGTIPDAREPQPSRHRSV